MLKLNAKLNELNEDGLFLVRLLQNDDFPTIQGAEVNINKFSKIFLRSKLTYSERTRKYNANGEPRRDPLSDAEEKRLVATVRVYGETDNGLYTFAPVIELYNRGNRCVWCVMKFKSRYDTPEPDGHPHPEQLNGGTHAEQINRLGMYFRWWIDEGGFEPIAPTEPDMKTERALNALFGKRREIPIDDKILAGQGKFGDVSDN